MTSSDLDYKQALVATDSLDSPAEGFVRPQSYKVVNEGIRIALKQNNTIIQLILQLKDRVARLEEEVAQLKGAEKGKQPSADLNAQIEAITGQLKNIHLGDPKKTVGKATGSFLIKRSPKLILKSEKDTK